MLGFNFVWEGLVWEGSCRATGGLIFWVAGVGADGNFGPFGANTSGLFGWDEDFNWVFFVRPTTIQQLIEIADNSEVMPPKSTFFYPKFLSGFINAEL